MSCCGKSRVQASGLASRQPGFQPKSSTGISAPPVGTVAFEYTGTSRLTVIGPVTRLRYEFQGHGARLNVDRRDSASLATVATLRRV
jgi:hypothetical protein